MDQEPSPSAHPRRQAAVFENAVSLRGASRALVAQVWIYNRSSKESHHVLSQADLVPDELPLIDVPENWSSRLGKESEWTAYGETSLLRSEDALSWYDKVVHAGEWAPPWREPHLSQPVAMLNVLSEPAWPSVVTTHGDGAIPPVRGRDVGTRHHHVLCEEPAIPKLLDDDECRKLLGMLRDHGGVDLEGTPELWQSAHFFQPVPFLRHVSCRLDSTKEGGDRAVLFDVIPRRGEELERLELHLIEHRPTGWRLLSRLRLDSPFFEVPLNEDVAEISFRVFHDEAGLLWEEGPYSFLRSIELRMNLISHERRVQLPARKGRPARLWRIPMGSDELRQIGGSEPERSATQVLNTVKYRLKARSASQDQQMWFRGDVRAAEEAVQKILSSAHREALVVDPYFAAPDVRVWLPSVASGGAQVRVLTSSAGLRQRSIPDSASKEKERESEHLTWLRTELEAAARDRQINATTVHVMVGDHPAIHDRFLVADDRAWLLGSSLNMFGTRGTMLVQLPSPKEIISKIEEVWRDRELALELAAALSRLAPANEQQNP